MNVCRELEIYIPEEAEVQSIPLQSLPRSVLKRMRLPLPDCDPSRTPADMPTVTWICPAFVCKKGPASAPPMRSGWAEGVRTLKQWGSRSAPLKMSFKSSNRVALEVLKDGSHKPHIHPLPLGTAPTHTPTTNNTGLVIYGKQIYLCIKKSELCQKQKRSSACPEPENVTESSWQTKASPGEIRPPLKESCAALRRESGKRVRLEQEGGEASSTSSGCEDAVSTDEGGAQTRSSTLKESASAPASAVALRLQFDFGELEEEEEIAQMKARFLRDEAALNDLLSGP